MRDTVHKILVIGLFAGTIFSCKPKHRGSDVKIETFFTHTQTGVGGDAYFRIKWLSLDEGTLKDGIGDPEFFLRFAVCVYDNDHCEYIEMKKGYHDGGWFGPDKTKGPVSQRQGPGYIMEFSGVDLENAARKLPEEKDKSKWFFRTDLWEDDTVNDDYIDSAWATFPDIEQGTKLEISGNDDRVRATLEFLDAYTENQF